jgi:hypothetical protein
MLKELIAQFKLKNQKNAPAGPAERPVGFALNN